MKWKKKQKYLHYTKEILKHEKLNEIRVISIILLTNNKIENFTTLKFVSQNG